LTPWPTRWHDSEIDFTTTAGAGDAVGDLDAGLAAGRAALAHASQAVAALAGRFDPAGAAVNLLLATPGRVVVTGLGKSGLVGAKLAATLSSTGTAAFFVHAADALHGDAGSVAAGDVVIAISNSGETDEVCCFAQVLKSRGVPVIALTGCHGCSTLAQLADVLLDVGVQGEADPYDLVPSSSTTATLVMGDALAIAAMVARGFGPADFHGHHPAGALGRRLAGGTRRG
jgi:arabinose-5-phosphate isomerase